MGVKVKVDADMSAKINNQRIGRALTAAATQTALELNDYEHGVVPRLQGDLRGTATPEDASVVYDSTYAAAQFEGGYTTRNGSRIIFHNYTTPGTGPHWDKMVQDNPQKMARIRDAYLKGLSL